MTARGLVGSAGLLAWYVLASWASAEAQVPALPVRMAPAPPPANGPIPPSAAALPLAAPPPTALPYNTPAPAYSPWPRQPALPYGFASPAFVPAGMPAPQMSLLDTIVDENVGPALGSSGPAERRIDLGLSAGSSSGAAPPSGDWWSWQFLPDGLMYKSYMSGGRESRFASQWIHERDQGWLWDVALGGHVGILRFGNRNEAWPEGWQIDVEGAAFPRLDLENDRDLVSTDFRFGIPLTARCGRWEGKFGYYHLSSHLGDEYMVRYNTLDRINFVRDTLVLGVAFYPHPDWRLYSEAGWAFYTGGGSQPWEFQFGIDASSAEPTGICGGPFFTVNGRIREELDYGGNFTMQTGWQWRGRTGRVARTGLQYFNGMSDQYQFFDRHEEQLGVGVWYDY